MAFGIGRGMTAPLAVLNFILYFISACLAGSILNHNLDGGVGSDDPGLIGNVVTSTFLIIALIASVVGMASCLAGAHHLRLWRTETLAAAAATSVIAWLLTLLAMGIACKEIHTGGYRTKRLKTLEAFMIILAFLELLYLLTTHAGSVTGEGYTNTPGNRAVKNPNYGTPAATAV
ncbi:hypothetical protein M758_9G104300 [Ceratodon purpureus]|uniref:Uncharacterized protein n=1 Tax=Ceratodon purpureus TaxID=3225 RepID=A0A8T0GVC5_CERPU|nr:hypothetical protein KC19_9G152600 [Ceratodon purpureus]KAG0605987.1 hypothetical protein M758_9G104300 [Ceratodon purpureus]